MLKSLENRRKEAEIKRTLQRISEKTNEITAPAYNMAESEEYKVHIKVDNSVSHGMFKPVPGTQGQWLATEQTFKAMKKDIFSLADDVDELKEPYECSSCKSGLDMQFWFFCPYCGEGFSV